MKDLKAICCIVITMVLIGYSICTCSGSIKPVRIEIVEDFAYLCEQHRLKQNEIDADIRLERYVASIKGK